MANESLAVSSHSSNPVSEIAYLITLSLQERCSFSPEDHPYPEYLRDLATVMGLGFTVILAEGSRIRSCRLHLATFLRYRDFISHADQIETVSTAIAETICTAVPLFKQLGFPLYYDNFVRALSSILKSYGGSDTRKKEEGMQKMLQHLFEMCNAL